jgi:hypothetical protein
MTAARAYKDITGGMSDAVDRMRRHDTACAVRLTEELVERDEDMRRAANRAALSELAVYLWWEAAMESLWGESWMTLRPLPLPDPRADPRDLDYLDAVVEQRYDALMEIARRRPLLGRR